MLFINKYISTNRRGKTNAAAEVEDSDDKDGLDSNQDNCDISAELESVTGDTPDCQKSPLPHKKENQLQPQLLQQYFCRSICVIKKPKWKWK